MSTINSVNEQFKNRKSSWFAKVHKNHHLTTTQLEQKIGQLILGSQRVRRDAPHMLLGAAVPTTTIATKEQVEEAALRARLEKWRARLSFTINLINKAERAINVYRFNLTQFRDHETRKAIHIAIDKTLLIRAKLEKKQIEIELIIRRIKRELKEEEHEHHKSDKQSHSDKSELKMFISYFKLLLL
jgi:hypothetical protein